MTKLIDHQDNITLDTSFIEGQNFLSGSKIDDLSKLCREGSIKLYLTDITYREVLARFKKNINYSIERIKKPIDLLSNAARILRNFKEFDSYFSLPIPDSDKLCSQFQSDFDKWIKKNKVIIISCEKLTIKDVFDDYFNNNPPFSDGIKKHEFPDAFALKAIEEHFKNKKNRTYLISNDKDILEYKSKFITTTNDAPALLDSIIRNSAIRLESKAIKLIEGEFTNSKFKLEKDIIELIKSAIEDEFGSTYMVDDLEIDSCENINIDDIELYRYSILNLDIKKGTAKIEYEITYSFEIIFSANDYSEAWHDNEEGEWHFVENKNYKFQDSSEVAVIISADFDLKEEWVILEVEEINNGRKLNVLEIFSSKRR